MICIHVSLTVVKVGLREPSRLVDGGGELEEKKKRGERCERIAFMTAAFINAVMNENCSGSVLMDLMNTEFQC